MAKGELREIHVVHSAHAEVPIENGGSSARKMRMVAVAAVSAACVLAAGLVASPHASKALSPMMESSAQAHQVALSAQSLSSLSRLAKIAQREEEQSASHDNPVEEAIQRHSLSVQVNVKRRLNARKMPDAERSQLAAFTADKGKADFSDHPWDLFNPEGMPMPDGSMESAAALVAQAGNSVPLHAQAAPQTAEAKRLEADTVMAGGGTVDPRAMLDLSEGLREHESIDGGAAQQQPQVAAQQQQQQAAQFQAQQAQASSAAPMQDGKQGFVTGSRLQVSADEYHRRMHYYMPSTNGKLISPFEWFQAAGAPPPAPVKAARQD
jgi:hypothetical protein